MSSVTLPITLLKAPQSWAPGAIQFLVELNGHPAQVHLRNGHWHVWTITPAFHLDTNGIPRCEHMKRYLLSPYLASLSEEAIIALEARPEALIEEMQKDFERSYTPTPIGVTHGDLAMFEQALRDTIQLTGCYAVTEARHPSKLDEPSKLACLGVVSGNQHEAAAPLFHLVLNAFQPFGIEITTVDGSLEHSHPMIEMPLDGDTHQLPSQHDRIAAAGRLRALFEARPGLSGGQTGLEASLSESNLLEDILNDAIAHSAW